MRRALVGVVAVAAMFIPNVAPATEVVADREPESCFAVNPGQPTCTFTVTSTSSSGTVTGAVGPGDWTVVVKRGKKKLKFGPGSEPAVSFAYQEGDVVTATVNAAGGWVLAGHD